MSGLGRRRRKSAVLASRRRLTLLYARFCGRLEVRFLRSTRQPRTPTCKNSDRHSANASPTRSAMPPDGQSQAWPVSSAKCQKPVGHTNATRVNPVWSSPGPELRQQLTPPSAAGLTAGRIARFGAARTARSASDPWSREFEGCWRSPATLQYSRIIAPRAPACTAENRGP